MTDRFFIFHKGCLSPKLSTEAMKCATANEPFGVHAIGNKIFVKAFIDIGMVEMKNERNISCSPFGQAVLNICCLLGLEGASILECLEGEKLFLAVF